ncbi:MAG: hypothetical protein JO257_05050 [Deltaproteobacteria bacterium]|nr:hypothetical protein [Deltaproteobacteria bacterium]
MLVGSALLHGAMIALLVPWPHEPVRAPSRADVRVPPPPTDPALVEAPALVEVVILDEPASLSPGTAHALASTTHPANHEPGPANHEPGPANHEPGITTRQAPNPGGHGGAGLLHMRGADLALAPDTAERIAAGGPELPSKARVSGKLESASGGGAIIRDRVTTVVVEPDGTAYFHDKQDIDLHWHVPIPHLDVKDDLKDLGDALQEWYRDPYAATRYGNRSELSPLANAVPGNCDTWGDPMCDDPLAPEAEQRAKKQSHNTISYGGSADLTAWLYRRFAHADPYSSRKARLLDDTRAERIERGEKFRAEQAARSAELMQKALEELWARVPDPVARRQAVYELWSDCADDDAGARARAMMIGWVRARLPAGTADGYTPEELARMAPFAPYAE